MRFKRSKNRQNRSYPQGVDVWPKFGNDGPKIIDSDFVFKNCLFSKMWPSKSGYSDLRRRNSLPVRCFLGLYDASPARNIKFCVFDLDLERKTSSPFSSVGPLVCSSVRPLVRSPIRPFVRSSVRLLAGFKILFF